jgi:hypothetical protein
MVESPYVGALRELAQTGRQRHTSRERMSIWILTCAQEH